MLRNIKLYIVGALSIFLLAGCGGGTSGPANTVFVSASTKDGTALAVFPHFSSNGAFTGNTVSITFKSTPYTTNSSVDKSDVIINRVDFKYTPANFTPALSSLNFTLSVTPGGTTDLDNLPVLQASDFSQIILTGISSTTIDLTFYGVEVNTGATFTVPYRTTAIY